MRELIKIKDNVSYIPLGQLQANCYIIKYASDKVVVIDPGDESEWLIGTFTKLKIKPVAIINTHIHFDHIGANFYLVEHYNIPVYAHKDDYALLPAAHNWQGYMQDKYQITQPTYSPDDNQILDFGGLCLQVRHTPGHSPGSISLLYEDMLFCGDLVFAQGGYGRTDLWGGDMTQLMSSIRNKVLSLPDNVIICPGHDEMTNVGAERGYY